jgi:hypothetical protein
MAGEWLPVDCNLGIKPEVLEVAAATGQPVEVVIGRLVRLWSWAWLITADGTVKGSLAMLSGVAGGDETFWKAVEQAGWLVVGDKTLTIPGWEDRFSQAAKSRALAARRQETWRNRQSNATRNADRNASALPEERKGEEMKGEVPPPPREASQDGSSWQALRSAWNAGTGKAWRPAAPPDGTEQRLAEPGWLEDALAAIKHLPKCVYFRTPVTLPQFVSKAAFARDVLGGRYDSVTPKARNGDERPPIKVDPEWEKVRKATEEREARRRGVVVQS